VVEAPVEKTPEEVRKAGSLIGIIDVEPGDGATKEERFWEMVDRGVPGGEEALIEGDAVAEGDESFEDAEGDEDAEDVEDAEDAEDGDLPESDEK
jgi:hypothetical protein